MAIISKNFQNTDALNPSLEQIGQIARWFEAAVPNPTERNARTQIGVHLEEVSEMVQVLRDAGATHSARKELTFVADVLSYFQRQLESGALEIAFDKVDRVELLDALCDQIVTTVGIAHMLGMDIEDTLREVAASNDSRFGEDGRPIFNDQREIMKGPRYRSPDFAADTVRKTDKDD